MVSAQIENGQYWSYFVYLLNSKHAWAQIHVGGGTWLVITNDGGFTSTRVNARVAGLTVRAAADRVADNNRVRWGNAFFWISVAALTAAIFSQIFGWEILRDAILIAWVVFVLLVAMTRGMRWTSLLTFLSIAALLGAVTSQLAGAPSVRAWFLLAWAILLLPVAIALFSHPMRWPSWGLFVGFWAAVGVLWLIVLQILAVTGVLGGEAYGGWAAWPLALVGIWLVVASGLGIGAERFPAWVDGLGIVAGAGLLAISISTWIDASDDVTRAAGLFAAIAYVLWASGLGWVLWGAQDVTHRFRGLSTQRAA